MNAMSQEQASRTLSYSEAIREAMAIAMEADPTVILMGKTLASMAVRFRSHWIWSTVSARTG